MNFITKHFDFGNKKGKEIEELKKILTVTESLLHETENVKNHYYDSYHSAIKKISDMEEAKGLLKNGNHNLLLKLRKLQKENLAKKKAKKK